MYHNQLVYLVEAVRKNSIRKAAKALGMTQPSLSAAIIALEKEVGVRLLVRSNKGVSVTPEGRRFLTLAEDIVDKAATLQDLYRSPGSEGLCTFAVATNPSQITLRALGEMEPRIGEREYRVTVRNFSVGGCAESVRSMESELGVVFITSGCHRNYLAAFGENQLEYHRLSSRACCINLGRKNPLYNRKRVSVSELVSYPLARFVEDDLSCLDFSVTTDGGSLGQNKKIVYFNSDSSILSYVSQTDAYKIGFSWCNEDYEAFGIRCLELVGTEHPIELGWIKRRNQELTEIAALFVDTLTRLYGDTP